ncbi:hypothetical protein Tco_0162930 [Tanacetum coccineum]
MIHVSSKLHYFPLIKDRLNEARRSLFRTTCFGPWLDITYVENDDGMIHYVLQKQCYADDDSFDLPLIYYVNGHSLHFGRRQFCLVTGFKFGLLSLCEYANGDIPFRNRLFPKKIGYAVKIIDVLALIEDEDKFSKLEHLDGLRKNPNHVPSYSLSGFLFAFKIWIIESSCELDRWWTKVPKIIPRGVSWTRKAEFNRWEYFGELFHKAPIELALTKAVRQSNWYTPRND